MTAPMLLVAPHVLPSFISAGSLVAVALTIALVAAAALWRLRVQARESAPHVPDLVAPTDAPPGGLVPPVELQAVTPQTVWLAEATSESCGPPAHRGTPTRGVGYADLSRSCAELGRTEAAALAQWAADLRLVGPMMAGQAEGLPERVLRMEASSPRQAVRHARGEVLTLMAASDPRVRVPPLFPSADHIPGLPGPGARAMTPLASPDELRRRAVELMGQAAVTAIADPASARLCARLSDLAALDAVLLDSADRFGDEALVSVDLRQQLAAAALHDHCRALDVPSLVAEVRQTREVLRQVVEPHELAALEDALADEPAA